MHLRFFGPRTTEFEERMLDCWYDSGSDDNRTSLQTSLLTFMFFIRMQTPWFLENALNIIRGHIRSSPDPFFPEHKTLPSG